jgi:hypothetical protein
MNVWQLVYQIQTLMNFNRIKVNSFKFETIKKAPLPRKVMNEICIENFVTN